LTDFANDWMNAGDDMRIDFLMKPLPLLRQVCTVSYSVGWSV